MNQVALIVLLVGLTNGAHAQQVAAAKASLDYAEQQCLADAMYYEARGEGERGQRAVAEVVIARTKQSYRPHTVCGVVFEPYQFSFTFDGSMKRKLDNEAWADSMDLAESIMSGNPRKTRSITNGATYFARYDVKAPWIVNMNVTVQIGDHVFYRLKPKAERISLTRVASD